MKIRKPCRNGAAPGTPLWGYDYERYPLHPFKHNTAPEAFIPLHVCAGGFDQWHHKCIRNRHNSRIFAIEYVVDRVFIFTHNGVAHRCEKGDVFPVQSGAECSMCCETEYASKKMIRIEGALLKPLISSCGLENVTCGK